MSTDDEKYGVLYVTPEDMDVLYGIWTPLSTIVDTERGPLLLYDLDKLFNLVYEEWKMDSQEINEILPPRKGTFLGRWKDWE